MNQQETDQQELRARGINAGTPPVGKALDVDCDVCFVVAGEYCHDKYGRKAPAHVSRARNARWIKLAKVGQ